MYWFPVAGRQKTDSPLMDRMSAISEIYLQTKAVTEDLDLKDTGDMRQETVGIEDFDNKETSVMKNLDKMAIAVAAAEGKLT